MAHRSGERRQQSALFPVMPDELVEPDALVRVIAPWTTALPMANPSKCRVFNMKSSA